MVNPKIFLLEEEGLRKTMCRQCGTLASLMRNFEAVNVKLCGKEGGKSSNCA